jgi:hypothetical protein
LKLIRSFQLEKYFNAQQTHLYKRLDERHINYFCSPKQQQLLALEPIELPAGFCCEPLKEKDAEDILRDQALQKSVNVEVNR